ncbi:MAG: acyltransferase, partial [Leucobacter sp.]|nr:acyltransferase [Leucobacter sp.]
APLRRRGTIIMIIAVWGAVVGYQIVINVVPGTVLALAPMPLRRLGEFVIGMGLAQLAILGCRLRVSPVVGYGLLAAFATLLVVGLRFDVEHSLFQWALRLYEPFFILLFALIIFAVATRDASGGRSLLRHPVLVRLGEWSFAFYLVHATVIYAFRHLFDKQPMAISNLMWYLPVFAVALVLAWLLYRFVEHPVEGRMRKWGNAHLN